MEFQLEVRSYECKDKLLLLLNFTQYRAGVGRKNRKQMLHEMNFH